MKKVTIKSEFLIYDSLNDLNSKDKNLFKEAIKARDLAYAPYSNFLVGVAVLLENNEIITGNNQENAAYPSGLCAERVAVFYAAAKYPNIAIKKIAITAKSKNKKVDEPIAPCGACRQSISEYEIKQKQNITIMFMGEVGKIITSSSLKNLLPLSFDKKFL